MDRITQPPFKKSLEFNLPNPEKIFSHGENEIWFIPSTIGETVKIEIIFKAGKYFEDFLGEAQFTLRLLDKGTHRQSAGDIANALDYHGSHLDLKVGYDFSSISLYALKKNLNPLLSLLYEITQEPSLPDEELSLLKKIFIEDLRINLEKNEFVASNLIREKIYGSHPYGKSLQIKDIEKMNIERVRNFFKTRFKPYKIFIVGNIEPESIKSITENFDLSRVTQTDSNLKIADEEPIFQQIDGPSKKQSSIRMAKKTISRTHSDWPGLQLLNHALGGYFGSRLMKNIREEKGLTYGIHSSIQSMLQSSFINVAAEVNAQSSELALDEIHNELRRLPDIKDEELEMTKNHFIGLLQNDVTTIYAASERVKNLMLNALPFNYYKNLIQAINRLNQSDILNICRDYFKADSFSSIVVK